MNLSTPKESRYELKFICHEIYYKNILSWIKLNKFKFFREYPKRIVNNIYFDSIDNKLFSDNIYGNSSRIKLRYRWYGNLKNDLNANFEIKYKKNLFGWKKKIKINSGLIKNNYEWDSIKKKIYLLLPDNLKLLFKNNSNPQIINKYHRDYFLSFDRKIRITVDQNHKIFDQRFHRTPNTTTHKFTQNYTVVEFKFDRNNLKYYQKMLENFIPIQISKNSKYINSIRAITGR